MERHHRPRPSTETHRAGVYVNFLDSDDDTGRVREAYGDDTYRRLADVEAKYDPENVFHNNKNIQPARRRNDRSSIDSGHGPQKGTALQRLLQGAVAPLSGNTRLLQ